MHERSSTASHTPEVKVTLASYMPNTMKQEKEEEQGFHQNQIVFACENYLAELEV